MNKSIVATLFALAALGTGCTSTPEFQSGPDAEVTHDGLTRLDRTVMDVVWARTDIDLSGYSKIMFVGVGVEFRPGDGPFTGSTATAATRRHTSAEFQLDEATKALVKEEIGGAFVEELAQSDKYELVDAVGPDVLVLRAGLLDVVSRVPPTAVGRVSVYLDSVGEATLVMELFESTSDAILLRAVDRRAADSPGTRAMEATPVTNRRDVRRLGRQWAGIIRGGLETLMSGE